MKRDRRMKFRRNTEYTIAQHPGNEGLNFDIIFTFLIAVVN